MAGGPRVAILGVGSMGLGMAGSLIRKGFAVTGYDPNPTALAAFSAAGGTAAGSPAEAARDADVLLVVVVNARQTEAVLFGEAGAVAALKPGGVVVSSATMSPDEARAFAARTEAAGRLYLDAPISGGSARSAEGRLTVMASGAPAGLAAARPALEAMAETIYDLGPEPGTGAAFKIVNQLLAGVHIAVACEAVAFAAKLGLDLRRVYEVISASAGNSWMFGNRVPHVLDGDYSPKSATEIFVKDLGIVSDIGRAERFPLPLAGAALQQFVATAAAGMGRDDDASVARLFSLVTGVTLPPVVKPEPR